MQFHLVMGKSYEGGSLGKVGPLYKREKESKMCESVCETFKAFVPVASLEGNSESKLIQNFKCSLPLYHFLDYFFSYNLLAEKHLP